MTKLPTTLMKQLLDGCLLRVENQRSHVVVVRRVVTKVVSCLIPETEVTLEWESGEKYQSLEEHTHMYMTLYYNT